MVGESAVAAGVRRIEALTGAAARKHLAEQEKRLKAVAAALKVRPDEAAERVAVLVEERRQARARPRRGEEEARHGRRRQRRRHRRSRRRLGQVPRPRGLRHCAEGPQGPRRRTARRRVGSGVVAIVGVADDGKAGIVVGVTDDLTARFSAVDLVRRGAEALGGKGGGGRPDMAQAGGPDGGKADAALAAIEAAIAEAP